jgi:UDP-N-acetylmuramate dehydrogenase
MSAAVLRDAGVPLSTLTTLRLGGPARQLVTATTDTELAEAIRDAELAGDTILLLAGGSNLVIADEGFDGTVIHVATTGVAAEEYGESVRLTVAAGEPWDDVVARCVRDGLVGVETLSGIPGSTGATPIQNVGAYGEEVSSTIMVVRAWDRATGEIVELPAAACGFGYRTSAFKGASRYVVLSVTFGLARGPLSEPIRYAELARALGVEPGERAPLADVREAVLALRRGKGMVIDPDDPDSVSAGSFFTNPVLDEVGFARLVQRAGETLGADDLPPRFPAPDGQVKTSAAWLIERAGFGRGYARGRVAVSSKHTLALTNRGDATTEELLALAREIRDGVRDAFGVELVNEPVLVGVSL